MRVERQVELAARPDEVWPWIEDPDRATRWMDELVEYERTSDGRIGVGSTFRMEIEEGRRTAEYRAAVVEHDPPRRFVLEVTGPSFGDTPMTVAYSLHDLGDGRTRVDYVGDLEVEGLLWTLARPLLELMGRRRVGRHFRALRELTEAT